MPFKRSIPWWGVSGENYEFADFGPNHAFSPFAPSLPCVYIYCRLEEKVFQEPNWKAIYIGETEDLKQRQLAGHEKESCIKQNGFTHLHILQCSSGEKRKEIESDLILKHNPVCNIKGKKPIFGEPKSAKKVFHFE